MLLYSDLYMITINYPLIAQKFHIVTNIYAYQKAIKLISFGT